MKNIFLLECLNKWLEDYQDLLKKIENESDYEKNVILWIIEEHKESIENLILKN